MPTCLYLIVRLVDARSYRKCDDLMADCITICRSLIAAVQRYGIQLPRARCKGKPENSNDLAREAVSCNAVLAAGYNGMVLDRRMLSPRRAAKAARIAS
jgi:hypothetical protein